jgi:hypothetical protein
MKQSAARADGTAARASARAGWHGLCFEPWQAGRKSAAHDNSSNTGKGALDRKVQGAFRLFGTGDFP